MVKIARRFGQKKAGSDQKHLSDNHPLTDLDMTSDNSEPTKSKRWWQWRPSKKQALIGLAVIVVALGATGLWRLNQNHNKTAAVMAVIKPKPAATTVASKLTGIQVPLSVANSTVTAIMIENSDEARPQSGLSQAGVVFEALAEGGITRFMALYQESSDQISPIGPVRSARPYFIDWLLPFNAAYAHVGGSPTALSDIQSLGVHDMDQFYNGKYYNRISTREAPHNVYTSISSLTSLEQANGWTTSSFTGFPRKADAPAKSPSVTAIDINMSTTDMAVHYVYDPSLNSYLRNEGGSPMIDANTSKQLEPKVIIAIVVPWTDGPLDSSGAYYTDYSDIGNGPAYIFQDGSLTQGEWEKASPTSQIQFVDSSTNTPIKLDAGQAWISAVGDASEVSYK
jgi:hypothetical protein